MPTETEIDDAIRVLRAWMTAAPYDYGMLASVKEALLHDRCDECWGPSTLENPCHCWNDE